MVKMNVRFMSIVEYIINTTRLDHDLWKYGSEDEDAYVLITKNRGF